MINRSIYYEQILKKSESGIFLCKYQFTQTSRSILEHSDQTAYKTKVLENIIHEFITCIFR